MNKTILAGALAAVVLLTACGSSELAPNSFPGALVEADGIYVARGQHVYKHAPDGPEQWAFPNPASLERSPLAGQPVRVGDVIVVGEGVGPAPRHLFGINPATGAEVWRFTREREWVDGVITDGKLIYAPNGDGVLYALDPSQREGNSPKVVWQFATGNKLWSRPLLADGRLYQGSMDHKLYAVDASTGKEVWRFEDAKAPIAVQPTLHDGALYFGSFDSNMYAVNAADGKTRASIKTDGWIWSEATVSNGRVIAADVRGRVYAFDTALSQRAWVFDTNDSVRAQPVVKDDKVYIMSFDTRAYALNVADGKPAWAKPAELKFRLPSKPVLTADGKLLVTLFDSDTRMWVVDPASGATERAYTAKK